jgi:hypothetical protein
MHRDCRSAAKANKPEECATVQLKKVRAWAIWAVLSAILGSYLGCTLIGTDKRVFLPGKTTDGHYQFEVACASCHGEDGFAGGDALQKSCVRCHGAELKAVEDSHPRSKFTDPRNAERVKRMDATRCVTCHREHRPVLADAMGVTLPSDFCHACHQDVAKERKSHEGMDFASCAAAGCHNFHDNEALYEDFLVKHGNAPAVLASAQVRERNLPTYLREIGANAAPLALEDVDAPMAARRSAQVLQDWQGSNHAKGGVNCGACHAPEVRQGIWRDRADLGVCEGCHKSEHEGFVAGKHGLRLALSLPPLSPSEARLPMRYQADARVLDCNSCHGPHSVNTRKAAVDACLACHNDEHTKAYKQSIHYRLWVDEQDGHAVPGSGVSCATCHMPRIVYREKGVARTLVQHNQSFNLEPNEKMIRSVCMDCHGLAFSIDALADRELIRRNFQGKPRSHIESVDMALKREAEEPKRKRRKREG